MGKLIVTNTFDNAHHENSTTSPNPSAHTLTLGPDQSFTRITATERTIKWRDLQNLTAEQTDLNEEPICVAPDHIFVDHNLEIINPIGTASLLLNRKHHPNTLIIVYEVKDWDIERVRFTDWVITPILLYKKGCSAPVNHEWTARCNGERALLAYAPLLFISFHDAIHLREDKGLLNEMLGKPPLRTVTVTDLCELLGFISRASIDKYKKKLCLTRAAARNRKMPNTTPKAAPQPTTQVTDPEQTNPTPESQPPEYLSPKQRAPGEKRSVPADTEEEIASQSDLFE